MGDFNARTGTLRNPHFHDDPLPEAVDTASQFQTELPLLLRNSQDLKIDTRGRELLKFAVATNLWCLNGTTRDDPEGSWTFHNHLGKSVVDYCWVDKSVLERVLQFKVDPTLKLSDHHPILVRLKGSQPSQPTTNTTRVNMDPSFERGFYLDNLTPPSKFSRGIGSTRVGNPTNQTST